MSLVVGSNDIGWVHKNVDKEGEGILTLWNNNVFQCERIEEGKGFIAVEG